MIERTTFDLRIAAHTTATAAVNQTAWQRQVGQRPVRARLAAALIALAARLDPAHIPAMPGDAQSFPAPAA